MKIVITGHRGFIAGHYYNYLDKNGDYLTPVDKELGCAKINLQIRNDNKEAVKFYHELGYKNKH